MTNEQKQKFIEAAKNPDYKKFDGYVCLGYGGSPDLSDQLGGEPVSSYWNNTPNGLNDNWSGGFNNKLYYLTQEKWNKIFGEVEDATPKAYRFDSQEELDNLVEKFGKDYFDCVPSLDNANTYGYLLKNGKYGNCWSSYKAGMLRNTVYFSYEEAMNTYKKEMTMEEKVNYAKSFIGKRIKSAVVDDLIGTVTSVSVLIDKNDSDINSREKKDEISKQFDEDGYIIALKGTWNTGQLMFRPIGFDSKPIELAPNTVKINGYESEDKGEYFLFGCAKISKQLLQDMKHIMEVNDYEDSNRKVESVKIGAGEFTLKDIQTLLS